MINPFKKKTPEEKERLRQEKAERKAKEAEEERLWKIEQEKRDRVYHDTVKLAKAQAEEPKKAPEGSYISLQHINKIYGNHVQAVYDFNLEVKQHEFIVLVGPSGCGKSTTLRMIAGLESITSGDLYINGEYSNDLEPKDRDLAMVFQNYALYPHMTVYANLAFGLKMRKIDKDDIDRRVKRAAEILELEDYLDRKPGELSGGQCQRVALGRAIVRETGLFLMDEPLSNLDAKLRVQMRSEIVELHKTIGATTVYVTHDQTEAMTMASRIVVMKGGYIQQIGTPKEVYANPANVFVATFIGSPAMNIVPSHYHKGTLSFSGHTIKLDKAASEKAIAFYEGEIASLKAHKEELLAQIQTEELESFKAIEEEEVSKIDEKIGLYEGYVKDKEFDVYLGIRPEDIHKADAPSEATRISDPLSVEVASAEYLGKEYFVHVNLENEKLIAKIGAKEDIDAGAKIELCLDLDKMALFDKISEKRIPLK